MTTIFTLACPLGVLQLGDRLVSVPVAGQPASREAYDRLANKQLLYCANNAIVAIGYSGPAYLQNLPTDEWIAEKLWRKELPRFLNGRPVMQIGRGKIWWPDVGYAVRGLRDDLRRLRTNMHDLSIVFAGFQEAGRRERPIMVLLERKARRSEVQLTESERWWPKPRSFRLDELGGYLTDAAAAGLKQRIMSASPGDFDAYEQALVEAIRDISAANPGSVGSNLLSVLIPHHGFGTTRIKFLPTEEHMVAFTSEAGTEKEILTTHFSPWLIAQQMICPPSFQVGDSVINLGLGFEIAMHGAPPRGGILGASGGYNRMPPP